MVQVGPLWGTSSPGCHARINGSLVRSLVLPRGPSGSLSFSDRLLWSSHFSPFSSNQPVSCSSPLSLWYWRNFSSGPAFHASLWCYRGQLYTHKFFQATWPWNTNFVLNQQGVNPHLVVSNSKLNRSRECLLDRRPVFRQGVLRPDKGEERARPRGQDRHPHHRADLPLPLRYRQAGHRPGRSHEYIDHCSSRFYP